VINLTVFQTKKMAQIETAILQLGQATAETVPVPNCKIYIYKTVI